jgi:hypothetical protein
LNYKAGNTKDTIDCTLHRAVMWNDISLKLFQKFLGRYRDNVTVQDNEEDTYIYSGIIESIEN